MATPGVLRLLCFLLLPMVFIRAQSVSQAQPPLETQQTVITGSYPPPKRNIKGIAIIGAGLSGSAAAFELRGYPGSERHFNVTVFERASASGGQVASVQIPGPNDKLETGASAFAEDDWCVNELIRSVGLRTVATLQPSWQDPKSIGVWDGRNSFLCLDNHDRSFLGSWWQSARLLWKYGPSPVKLHWQIKATMKRLHDLGRFSTDMRDLQRDLESLGLLEAAHNSASYNMTHPERYSAHFINDIVRSRLRHRYNRDIDDVNALSAIAAMRTAQSQRIVGGNDLLPHRLLLLSEAQIHYDTAVTRISSGQDKVWRLTTQKTADEPYIHQEFDAVIMTAPWPVSDIIDIDPLPPSFESSPSNEDYVDRHITHFTTWRDLEPSAFNQPPNFTVPDDILTAPLNVTSDDVFSIITPQRVVPQGQRDNLAPEEFLYRIASAQPFSDGDIAGLLGEKVPQSLSSIGVTWVQKKTWERAQPKKRRKEPRFWGLKQANNFWYTAALRDVWDSLEMSCVAGKGASDLLQIAQWV